MRFARVVFLVAGIYGLLVLTPLYFMEGTIGRQTPPPISHPEYFYGFVGTALAWQVAYLVFATDPARYRILMVPGTLTKVLYGISLIGLRIQHRIPGSAFAVGSVDWIFAALFVAAYFSTARETPAIPRTI